MPRTSSGWAVHRMATSPRRPSIFTFRLVSRHAVLGFWYYPKSGGGMIGNDLMVLLQSGKSPRLAHEFLNFMLDKTNSYNNFINFNGYQTPHELDRPERARPGFRDPPDPGVSRPWSCRSHFDDGHFLLELPRRRARGSLGERCVGTRSRPVASQATAPEQRRLRRGSPPPPSVEAERGHPVPTLVLAVVRCARHDLVAPSSYSSCPFYVGGFGSVRDRRLFLPATRLPVYQPWYWSGFRRSSAHVPAVHGSRRRRVLLRPSVVPNTVCMCRSRAPSAWLSGMRSPITSRGTEANARGCTSSCFHLPFLDQLPDAHLCLAEPAGQPDGFVNRLAPRALRSSVRPVGWLAGKTGCAGDPRAGVRVHPAT